MSNRSQFPTATALLLSLGACAPVPADLHARLSGDNVYVSVDCPGLGGAGSLRGARETQGKSVPLELGVVCRHHPQTGDWLISTTDPHVNALTLGRDTSAVIDKRLVRLHSAIGAPVQAAGVTVPASANLPR